MMNIDVRSPSPASVNWKDQTQKEIIKKDFFEICYVCERYVPIDYEIDHFFPQNKFSDRENDWGNLYFSCQKCNKIKPKNTNHNIQIQRF